MPPVIRTALAVATACLLPQAAWAQQAPRSTTVEIAPFVGKQSGADFTDQTTGTGLELKSADSAGLVVNYNLRPDTQLEFLYSRAKSEIKPDDGGPALTDLKVEYLHVGAAYVYNGGRTRPFLSVTAGATLLDPSLPGSDRDIRFSLGIAGGVKLFLTDNIGLRLAARAVATQVDSDSAAFCVNGACRIYYDGDFMTQYAANIGVIVAF